MSPRLSQPFQAVLLLLVATLAVAQSPPEHFTTLGYDEVGRVGTIETAVEEAAPTLTAMSPAIVRHGPAVAVTLIGTSLRGAVPTASHPGLTISAVTAEAARVTLMLQADASVPVGEHRVSVVTVLGSAEIAFTVYPQLPVLTVAPNPLAVEVGKSATVTLRTDRPDVIAHTLQLTTASNGIATVSPNSLVLPVGGVDAGSATVAGLAGGTTVLRVRSDEILDVLVPVFVTPRYQPPVGGAAFWSLPLGVLVGSPTPPPELISRGPFTALLGVVMPGTPAPAPIGVGPLAAPLLGVSIGPVAQTIRPSRVVRGDGETRVEVHGVHLAGVTGVSLLPADDVAIALAAVDGDGARVQLAVTAEQLAALGPRRLRLTTATGSVVPFAAPGADLLGIVDPLPELASVSPLLLVRGSASTTLTIRGIRLAGASAVRLTPADGITIGGSPAVDAAGGTLTVNLAVAADAPLGPRIVSVMTASGASSELADASNTVQVVDALGAPVTPVVAPLLGVQMGGEATAATPVLLGSATLGVSRGAVFSALRPDAAAIDSTVTLQVDGAGLHGVTAVAFEPPDGVTLSTPTIAADGRQLQATLTIAAAAPRGLRRVRLLSAAGEVWPSQPAAAQFRITDQLPQVEALSPVVWVAGAAPATLTLRGRYLADATTVRFVPADGVTLSAPGTSADGTELTTTVAIAADAALGPRVVVVDAPAGSTGDAALPSNTVQLVAGIGTEVTPLASPLLGVTVASSAPPLHSLGLVSPRLGVHVAETRPPALHTHLLPSATIGVVLGPAATALTPRYLPVGRSATLRVEGIGLERVATLQVLPDEGITLDGAPQAAADGSSVSVPISIAADAAQTARRVLLAKDDGSDLPFAVAAESVVRVVGNEPRIDSIDPIQVTPGRTFALTIRGGNLFDVSAVTATPATGLTFSANPSGNAEGTEVTLAVTVAADAPGGPRVIQVHASTGVTTGEAIPANTLTVVTGQ